MGLQIYGNIDAGSLLTGKAQAVNDLTATGIKNLVAGDGLEVELFLTSQSGLVDIQNYSVRLGIGDLNARPTGGTWDLGSETGLAYNIDASTLQSKITSATSGSPANTTTQLSPFVFKTVFTANGSQTIPTIDSTGLTPSSTVSITKLVTGDGSTKEQWLTRIFRNPIAFQDTFQNFTKSGVGNGVAGILGLGTPEIYSQFSETVTSFSSTLEMEITDTDGNTITIFQIPVTIGGEALGAGITVSSLNPSTFVTASDVNTQINNATTRANQLFVSKARGNDSTASRNSTTNPYLTITAALADVLAGDSIHFLDGSFLSETIPTITTNNLNIFLEQGVDLSTITFNGNFLRVKGLGSLQGITQIDTSGGTGSLVLEKLYLGAGLKLNPNGNVRADKCDTTSGIEFTTGSSTSHKYFNDCIIRSYTTNGARFVESGVSVFFDNCIFETQSHDIFKFTNTTTAPNEVFFKDCLLLCPSSYTAFTKTSSATSIALDFVGGTTGMSYFGNPSDFTIRGNYTCQTQLVNLPYLLQQ